MSHSQGRTFFRVPSNTFMEFVVKRIRGWRWEKVALITHNKMWGRTFSPKGKKALLPSDLLRGCTMECIRWSRIAFPVLFFFFLFFFFTSPSVAFCPGGLQVLGRAQYPHIHILILFWCQNPVPMDNTCSDSPPSPTQCLLFWLVHSHPSPHRQSLSEPCWGETAFSLKPPRPPPPQTQFPYIVGRASECGITHLRRIAIDKTSRIKQIQGSFAPLYGVRLKLYKNVSEWDTTETECMSYLNTKRNRSFRR